MTVPMTATRMDVASGGEPLEALAVAREQLIRASVELRRLPDVERVGTGLDCRGYQSGSALETYVEAEFRAGYTLTWWLEITWNREWMIAARIYRDDDVGQTTLRHFADRVASDPREFVVLLAEVVDEVSESIGLAEGASG